MTTTETDTMLEAALLESIVTLARERAAILDQLRTALERQDDTAALQLARCLCGLTTDFVATKRTF